MITLTAILRAKPGHEEQLKAALIKVVEHTRANEPDTISYFAGQDTKDPCVFNTYERYPDMEALERHNNSAAVAEFFTVAKPIMVGDQTVVISREIAIK